MAPTVQPVTPGSENEHANDVSGPNNEAFKVIRKRNRVPLSCAPCRNRKLKCNRSAPCENCVKRGDAHSCSYAAPGGRRKTTARMTPATTPDDMQQRIDRLESLVLSLMTNGNESASPVVANRTLSMTSTPVSHDFAPPQLGDQRFPEEEEGESETDKVAQSFGVLHVHNNKQHFVQDGHWAAILNGISEVKNYFGEHKEQYMEAIKKVEASQKRAGTQYTGPAFILGGGNTPLLSDLLSSLPGKDAVDKLVGRYFNDFDPATHVLHPPSWRRLYDKHWLSPDKTNAPFLAQLYAICGLAMDSYHKYGDEPYEYRGRTQSLATKYRSLTQQCLLLFDYQKPEHAVLEALVLHMHGEHNRTGEADIGIWVLTGMAVRLAMRMGLHRDAEHYPDLSPFMGEMRRRIWTFIRQADMLFSFAVGLPSMVRSCDTDTELPRNLHDEDFDEDTEVLPPPRPLSDFTPVSYMISKSVIALVFGKIAESVQSLQPTGYEEVMALDQELRDAYHSLPPVLQMKSMDESMMDPISTLTMRFRLSMLYNKGLCVLHRKHLTRARENTRFSHSRQTCMDASLTLLRHQSTLHLESQPGRRLHKLPWFASSLATHDFLLAATLIALDLYYSAQAESVGHSSGDVETWGTDRRDEMIEALETSRGIWHELKDRFIEAFKASTMLGIMLLKITSIRAQTATRMAQGAFGTLAQQYSPPEEEKPEHSAAITLGMLSSGGLSTSQPSGYNGPYPPTPGSNNAVMTDVQPTGTTPNFSLDQTNGLTANAPSPFPFFNGPSMEMPANVDWAAWDQYIQNSEMDPNTEMWPQPMEFPIPNPEAQGQPPAQLNSNLFANNPAHLPPGMVL